MSSTNRGSERSPADFYPTPGWCVERLLEHPAFRREVRMEDWSRRPLWLEPGAGEGAIILAVNQALLGGAPLWTAVDIRPEVKPSLDRLCEAALLRDIVRDGLPAGPWDLVIGNPPFREAQAFIEKSLMVCDSVVFLLRLAYLSSGKRAPFMRANPPDVYVLPDRPSFNGVGVDSADYGWFHWHGQTEGRLFVLENTPAEQRRPRTFIRDRCGVTLGGER
jgi:hypothetical protein